MDSILEPPDENMDIDKLDLTGEDNDFLKQIFADMAYNPFLSSDMAVDSIGQQENETDQMTDVTPIFIEEPAERKRKKPERKHARRDTTFWAPPPPPDDFNHELFMLLQDIPILDPYVDIVNHKTKKTTSFQLGKKIRIIVTHPMYLEKGVRLNTIFRYFPKGVKQSVDKGVKILCGVGLLDYFRIESEYRTLFVKWNKSLM